MIAFAATGHRQIRAVSARVRSSGAWRDRRLQKCLYVLIELFCGLGVEALNGRFFNRTIYALDLAVDPEMCWLCETVLYAKLVAVVFEAVPNR